MPDLPEIEDAADDLPEFPVEEPIEEVVEPEQIEVPEMEPAAKLVATRPAGRPNRPSSGWMGWTAFASATVAVIAGTILLADYIVELWPPAKRLYAMVNLPLSSPSAGLELRDIRARYEASPEGPRLVIEGDIVNVSSDVKAVPMLRVALHDDDQEILTDWVFAPTDLNMMPNEIVTFRTRREAPPANATGAALGFSSEPVPKIGASLERSAARE